MILAIATPLITDSIQYAKKRQAYAMFDPAVEVNSLFPQMGKKGYKSRENKRSCERRGRPSKFTPGQGILAEQAFSAVNG
jgi:hypothetical protein